MDEFIKKWRDEGREAGFTDKQLLFLEKYYLVYRGDANLLP